MLTRPNTVLDTIIGTLNEYIAHNSANIRPRTKPRDELEMLAKIIYDYTETDFTVDPDKKLMQLPSVNNGDKKKNDKMSVTTVNETLAKLNEYLSATKFFDPDLAKKIMKNINEGRGMLQAKSPSAAAKPLNWKKAYGTLYQKSKEFVYVGLLNMGTGFTSTERNSESSRLKRYNGPNIAGEFKKKSWDLNGPKGFLVAKSSEEDLLKHCLDKFHPDHPNLVSYLFKINLSEDEFMKLIKENKSDLIFDKVRIISCINSQPEIADDESRQYVQYPLDVKFENGKFVEDIKPENRLTRSPK